MGQMITLTCSDAVTIGAYRAAPAGRPVGGMVVLQEIFGINAHIQSVADSYAAAGYLAIAPALFDRASPNEFLGYAPADVVRGRDLKMRTSLDNSLADIAAAVGAAAQGGKVGLVGYCWGGFLAFMAAARVPGLSATVGYYGGGIAGALGEKPRVPVILHFGEKDAHISMADVASIRAAQPELPVYTYPADHGFNRLGTPAYDAPSAELARKRSLEHFALYLG